MPTSPAPAPSPDAAAILAAFLALVAAVAVAGAVLAFQILGGGAAHAQAPAGHGPYRVAEDVPTSFGYVAVEHAETTKGLTAKDLAGAVHGIGSLVTSGDALVQASITLTNTGHGTLDYAPEQFTLVARKDGRARRHRLAHANVRPGTLQPDAAIDARISFVTPRDGAALSIEFDDPGSDAPVVIDLGRHTGVATAADIRAAQSHGAGHDH